MISFIIGLVLNMKSVSKSLSNIISKLIIICCLLIVFLTYQEEEPYNYIMNSLSGLGLGWIIRDYLKTKKKE